MPGRIEPGTFVPNLDRIVNRYRRSRGLADLESDETLTTAALAHARRMLEGGFFDHVDPMTGSGPMERVRSAGSGAWILIAENLAAGPWLPEQVLDGWIASPPHHSNLLLPDARLVGTAVIESTEIHSLIVQLYGTRSSGLSVPRTHISPPAMPTKASRIRAPSFGRVI